jgi:hypothetical protein
VLGAEDTMRRRRGVRRSEEQWSEILGRFGSSGLTARRFCDREGVPLSSLQRWQRRLRSVPAAKFVEIAPTVSARSAATWSFEVSLPDGTTLRLQG